MTSSSSNTSYAASTTLYTPPTSNYTTTKDPNAFTFPPHASFPPFYTLQPNLTTRARQLALWSMSITSYCQYHRITKLSLSSPPADLFTNTSVHRSLAANDIRTVLDWMSKPENGGRIEWISANTKGEPNQSCYVYWRTLGEWADMIYAWVDETGQQGAVLTVYELRESDAVRGREWYETDEGLLRKALNVLVKRGKAQIFGQEESAGVKFF